MGFAQGRVGGRGDDAERVGGEVPIGPRGALAAGDGLGAGRGDPQAVLAVGPGLELHQPDEAVDAGDVLHDLIAAEAAVRRVVEDRGRVDRGERAAAVRGISGVPVAGRQDDAAALRAADIGGDRRERRCDVAVVRVLAKNDGIGVAASASTAAARLDIQRLEGLSGDHEPAKRPGRHAARRELVLVVVRGTAPIHGRIRRSVHALRRGDARSRDGRATFLFPRRAGFVLAMGLVRVGLAGIMRLVVLRRRLLAAGEGRRVGRGADLLALDHRDL